MNSQRRSEVEVEDHIQGKDRIKVFVRIRPLRNQFAKKCLMASNNAVAIKGKPPFIYDGVFEDSATQENVFNLSCRPALDDVIKGNSASIFVYGQTGTGKTYTMGTLQAIKSQDQGLIPLALDYLVSHFKNTKSDKDWSIGLSFMQIYMEQIYDLLNPRNGKLKIRQDHEYGETYVEDLIIVPISNYKQSVDLINTGLEYRKTGNQKMNAVSSRSHTILTLYVSQKISDNEYMSSTLSFIDLAGSERVKKTNSTDIRLEEAKFINTSLSALGNVISELAVNDEERFIPFRTSKLTRILKNSLTGRSKITMICTLQISQSNLFQTQSTLQFADRCKSIRFPNQPSVSIQRFQELEQQKDLRQALQKSKQKEEQYLEMIKQLESGKMVHTGQETQRQTDLSNIIESIYRLFGEINGHLKKLLEPQSKSSYSNIIDEQKKQTPKVNSMTSIPAIKGNITKYAQETIDRINSLSTIAFGESKISGSTSYAAPEAEALLSLLLQNMRHNFKLQQYILIKDGKESLEKQIALQEYEKQKKQDILVKLKQKKLTSLVNHLEQIWSQRSTSSNPLQSLLNNIRREETSFYGDKSQISNNNKSLNDSKQFTSPKQFLKHLTRQQSQRKNKQILIDQGKSQDADEDESSREFADSVEENEQNQLSGSQIKYFQKTNSPMRTADKKPVVSNIQSNMKQSNSSNSEIKRLLENLIGSKSIHEEKKRSRNNV